jgi:hypothetical protein
MMKHTPGKWKWEEQFLPEDMGESNGIFILTDAGEFPLASITFCPERYANALLIAAAPELLEACKEAFSVWKHEFKNLPDTIGGRTIVQLKQSIAKAEGTSWPFVLSRNLLSVMAGNM